MNLRARQAAITVLARIFTRLAVSGTVSQIWRRASAKAWAALAADPSAHLVDVRTVAEWNFVGLPDLGTLGKRVLLVE